MKIFFFRRRTLAAVAAVILILFILRPGASRLKLRIASSISAALGRSVEIGSVHIQLLPRPGFELENVVVYDDPAFGSEPLLRAGEVTAALRLTSLARGRMEIARLDLTEPSLNLVHRYGGRWNLEALLERSAHAPLAPTAKAKSEPRPAFPYIEASSGRINFKFGEEKKPYALVDADFSLWQDSENSWGVRLRAQPFRSDLSLTDTGLLRVNGSWQRAQSLRDTPLQFSVEWDRPQLGQLTKFLTGADRGWRGAVLLDTTLTGTPVNLHLVSDASIRDFRRYDILTGEPVGIAVRCEGQFSSLDHMLREVFCRAPVGNGAITLHGDLGLPGSHVYDVVASAENLPASSAAALVQRVKKNLPQDLLATGSIEGSFTIRGNGTSSPQFEGQGQIADVRLSSASNKAEVVAASVPFRLTSDAETQAVAPRKNPFAARIYGRGNLLPGGPHFEFGPVSLTSTFGKSGLVARGWMSRIGYTISLAGETEIGRGLRLARLFGVPALTTTAEGAADVDLHLSAMWTGGSANPFASNALRALGVAKLRNIRVTVRGTKQPVEISSADLQFTTDETIVTHLTFGVAHSIWTGTLDIPRGCGTPSACLVHFNLNTKEATLGELRQWAAPSPAREPWYKTLTASEKSTPSFLGSLRATGTVMADRFSIQRLAATEVSANVSLDAGTLKIWDLQGNLLGGTHSGELQADFTQKPPVFSGSGTLKKISMARLADLMNDPWIAGVADGGYKIVVAGNSTADFWQSADATVEFEVRAGSLTQVSLDEIGDPLRFNRFAGHARLHEGKIEIKDALLNSPFGEFDLNGTASLTRDLDFRLRPVSSENAASTPSRTYAITGNLDQPHTSAIMRPETQARLKR